MEINLLGRLPSISPVLVLLSTFIFLTSCISLIQYKLSSRNANGANQHTVYTVSYVNHAGIIIDLNGTKLYLQQLKNEFPNSSYLELGWGDRGWYCTDTSDRSFVQVLRALFIPTSSAMFVWSLPKHPTKQYQPETLTELVISQDELDKLFFAIHDHFTMNEKGEYLLEKISFDNGGEYRIYQAKETYHIFQNCNSWATQMLRDALKN